MLPLILLSTRRVKGLQDSDYYSESLILLILKMYGSLNRTAAESASSVGVCVLVLTKGGKT